MSKSATKPKSIEVGKCYRMRRFPSFINYEPSDDIAYVYAINGKQRRWVCLRWLNEPNLGWNYASYSEFLRLVHSEAQNLKN